MEKNSPFRQKLLFRKNKNRLSVKIILLFTVVTVIVLIIQLIFARYLSDNIVVKNTDTLFEQTVYQISKRVDLRLQQCNDAVQELKGDYAIKQNLERIREAPDYYRIGKSAIMQSILKNQNLDLIDNIYIFMKDQPPINCFYSRALEDIPEYYLSYVNGYNTLLGNSIRWEVTGIFPEQLSAVTYLTDGDIVLGTLVMVLKQEVVGDIFDKEVSDGSKIYLLNSSNQIMYSNEHDTVSKYIYQYYGVDELKIRFPIEFQNWGISAKLSDQLLADNIKELYVYFGIIAVFTLAILLILPISLIFSIFKPMNKLLKGMEYVQRGDLNFVIDNNVNNEFKILIDNFNNMIRKIRELLHTTVEQQKLYRRSEMAALKSKLNPHFLYNTLDMIHWMLIMEDQMEIGDVVVTLAEILRYSASQSDELVTLGEDISQLEKYLGIQAMRFENKLSYKILVDQEVYECQVPKLLIQPVVENAIKYAFTGKSGTGEIVITAKMAGDMVKMEIIDNGVGMDKDKLARLRAKLDEITPQTGLGIQLVSQRLKDAYPDKTKIWIESAEKEGTQITILLPYVTAEHEEV